MSVATRLAAFTLLEYRRQGVKANARSVASTLRPFRVRSRPLSYSMVNGSENSEVLPRVSVAVAVSVCPARTVLGTVNVVVKTTVLFAPHAHVQEAKERLALFVGGVGEELDPQHFVDPFGVDEAGEVKAGAAEKCL